MSSREWGLLGKCCFFLVTLGGGRGRYFILAVTCFPFWLCWSPFLKINILLFSKETALGSFYSSPLVAKGISKCWCKDLGELSGCWGSLWMLCACQQLLLCSSCKNSVLNTAFYCHHSCAVWPSLCTHLSCSAVCLILFLLALLGICSCKMLFWIASSGRWGCDYDFGYFVN